MNNSTILNSETKEVKDFVGFTEEEKNEIAEKDVNLVRGIAHKYAIGIIDYDELFSVGLLGFTKALNTFNKLHGFAFSTYATRCINNEILTYLNQEREHRQSTVSISAQIKGLESGDDALELGDTLCASEHLGMDLEANIMKKEDMEMVLEAIEKLHPRERFIIECRNGLNGRPYKNQEELAEALNRTQPGISKAEKRAYESLKSILASKIELEDSSYYNGGKVDPIKYVI